MQNRYVGDIGDYTKLAILRALTPGKRLAVLWWLHPDRGPPGDGRHICYLDRPERWRLLDPQAFDALRAIVSSGVRSVAAIEQAGLLPGAAWHSEEIPTVKPRSDRAARRDAWFNRALMVCDKSDFVFVDPDNGLEPRRYDPAAETAAKSVSIEELRCLVRPDRALLVYHHHTRFKGGHFQEIAFWTERLGASGFASVHSIRARSHSPRVYFLINADDEMITRASNLCAEHPDLLSWHSEASYQSDPP